MKHQVDDKTIQRILHLADALGVRIDEFQGHWLARHLELVLEANRSFNLTAIEDLWEAARLMTADSLSVVPEVLGSAEGPIVDLGSGGGFPGVPLAIATDRDVTLVESTGKKARFLEDVARELAPRWNVRVVNSRVEETAAAESGRYAVATARALSALPSLVELAAPLLQHGGRLIALKGRIEPDELAAGDSAAALVGMARTSVREFALPEGLESRSIVVYERIGAPGIALPRRVGVAQKKPLA